MKVIVDLSAPEQHPKSAMPKILRQFWYSDGKSKDLRSLIDYGGCPNTGCWHKFWIKGDRADVVAWLDLFQDMYPDSAPEIMIVKKNIHTAFVHGKGVNQAGNLNITLSTITRQLPYKGELINRPWFWTESWEEEHD